MRGLLLPLVLLLAACQSVAAPPGFVAPPLQPGETLLTGRDAVHWRWLEPANYSFTIQSAVAMISLRGGGVPTRVVVRDHRRVEPERDSPEFATIAELQQRAQEAVGYGAFVAVVVAADGRPTYIEIDGQMSDDEFSASIADFQAE